jgi:hypothetical protein
MPDAQPNFQCEQIRRNGSRCKNRAAHGERMCLVHAKTLKHRFNAVTRNQTAIFIIALVSLIGTGVGIIEGVPSLIDWWKAHHNPPTPVTTLYEPPPQMSLEGEKCARQEIAMAVYNAWAKRRNSNPQESVNASACAVDAEIAKRGWNCKMHAAWLPVPVAKDGFYFGPNSKRNKVEHSQGLGSEHGFHDEGTDNTYIDDTTEAKGQYASCSPLPQTK